MKLHYCYLSGTSEYPAAWLLDDESGDEEGEDDEGDEDGDAAMGSAEGLSEDEAPELGDLVDDDDGTGERG